MAATIDAYIAGLPDEPAQSLQQVRKSIRAAIPGVEEVISYQIPTFKYKGRPLIAMAAFKAHCGIYTMSKSILEDMAEELAGFDRSGTTIRFPFGQPPSAALIKKIVKYLIKARDK